MDLDLIKLLLRLTFTAPYFDVAVVGQFIREIFTQPVLLAFALGIPLFFVWLKRETVRRHHAIIHSILAILFASIGNSWAAKAHGSHMAGFLIVPVAFLGILLAIALTTAVLGTIFVLLFRNQGEGYVSSRQTTSRTSRRHAPKDTYLYEQYRAWRNHTGRSRASYQDFLREARPEYFPPSKTAYFLSVLAMLLVFYLIFRH